MEFHWNPRMYSDGTCCEFKTFSASFLFGIMQAWTSTDLYHINIRDFKLGYEQCAHCLNVMSHNCDACMESEWKYALKNNDNEFKRIANVLREISQGTHDWDIHFSSCVSPQSILQIFQTVDSSYSMFWTWNFDWFFHWLNRIRFSFHKIFSRIHFPPSQSPVCLRKNR